MPLQPIKLRPGINRSQTNYGNEGGFYDCDKIRFHNGMPQKIGGWVKYTTSKLLGTARNLFNWVTITNRNLLFIGTNLKSYIEADGGLYDVTPVRATATLGTNPFASVNGTNVVTVTHANHGAFTGDFVTFSSATGFAGINATDLNKEFQITALSSNTYTITIGINASSTTTGGGASVSGAYQITTGSSYSVPGLGWNAGAWGRGTWNTAATVATFSTLRLWSAESFGSDLVFCQRNGTIYYWKFSNGLTTRATALTSIVSASNVPLMATKLLLSTADRHMIAFGTNALGSATQDPLLIRWCDTENLANWTPGATTAAGDLRVASGNQIVTAVKLKTEILVLTDASAVALQYVGNPFIFGLTPVADEISIMSPNAITQAGTKVFWMGRDKFYLYNGRVDTLVCPLDDYIFSDFNHSQAQQVHAGTCETFSEVWWFYCSKNATQIDRYVVFNHIEQLWYMGSLSRSAWLDSPMKPFPIAAKDDGYLYYHENGVDDDRSAAINAFVETSDFDIADGDDFMMVSRILPDMDFTGSTSTTPAVTMTFTPRNAPGASYRPGTAKPVQKTTAMSVGEFTDTLNVRIRGRQIKMRISSNSTGVQWRMGVPRVDMKPDGKK